MFSFFLNHFSGRLENLEHIFKNWKSQIFERFNRFWPNSRPKVFARYIIFVCGFRTITWASWKLVLPHISKQSKSHKTINRPSIVLKIVTIEVLSLLRWCTEFQIDISNRLRVIRIWKVENRTHTHTHSYIRTPAKNHISRRCRVFWGLSSMRKQNNWKKNVVKNK